MHRPKIVFITGPTGVGKTDVSFQTALKLGGEIVNADALQVYREVNIANNKPPQTVLEKVPHHLIGVISVTESFDVAAYARLAEEAVRIILEKGKVPIVSGGSGLYLQVLLDGIFDQETVNPGLRAGLLEQAERNGSPQLYARLRAVDPAAAAKIHPNDSRRIVRALEVFETSGRPISHLQTERAGLWRRYDIRFFCLNRPRSQLYERINRRAEKMFENGLVDEVRALSGLKLSRTASGMIGIREVRGFLQGDCSLQEAKEILKMNTRRYAKRQLTWFRKEQRLTWITLDPDETSDQTAAKIFRATIEGTNEPKRKESGVYE